MPLKTSFRNVETCCFIQLRIGVPIILWTGLVFSMVAVFFTLEYMLRLFQCLISVAVHLTALYGVYYKKGEVFLKPLMVFYFVEFILLCVMSAFLLALIIYVLSNWNSPKIGELLKAYSFRTSNPLILIFSFIAAVGLAIMLLYAVVVLKSYIHELTDLNKFRKDGHENDDITSDGRRHSIELSDIDYKDVIQ